MRFSLAIILVWLCLSVPSAVSFDLIREAGDSNSSASGPKFASVEPQVINEPSATAIPEPVEPTQLPSTDAPATANTPTYEYVEIPQATANSNTFRKVPHRVCPDEVSAKLMYVYKKNRRVFEACAAESHYQIFPYSGAHVTDSQLQALVRSKACRAIAIVCVVANVPECDISDLPLKAVTETLLKLMADVESGAMAAYEINRSLFFTLYQWRRDVNLAQTANVPFGGESLLYRDFMGSLRTALADSTVRVSSDLIITLDGDTGNDQDRPTSDTAGKGSQSSTDPENESGIQGHDRNTLPASSAKATQAKARATALPVFAAVVWLYVL